MWLQNVVITSQNVVVASQDEWWSQNEWFRFRLRLSTPCTVLEIKADFYEEQLISLFHEIGMYENI